MIPRRIPDYPDAYAGWNLVSSWGSSVSIIATLVWCYLLYDVFVNTKIVKEDPWALPPFYVRYESVTDDQNNTGRKDETLEWALKSPTWFHSYSILPATS